MRKSADKKKTRSIDDRRYFAIHERGLQNGSFFRVSLHGVAQFINGDYMDNLKDLPETYHGHPLVEFDRETAERLIPKVCL